MLGADRVACSSPIGVIPSGRTRLSLGWGGRALVNKAFVKEDDVSDGSVQFEESIGGGPRYVTPEGFARLQAESAMLETQTLPSLRPRYDALAALVEPTREQLVDLEALTRELTTRQRRFRFLGLLLQRLTVVPPQTGPRAYFGAYVTVEDEDGAQVTYRLVGPDEVDASPNYISVDSPVGRAVLGKKAGDPAPVRRPGQEDENLFLVEVSW